MNKKTRYLLYAIAFVLTGILLSWFYRPYIYANNIFDFHFADTIGNLVAIPSGYFFFRYKCPGKKAIIILIQGIIAIILYEILTLVPWHGTFDVYDIAATFFSGSVIYLILMMKGKHRFSIKELGKREFWFPNKP